MRRKLARLIADNSYTRHLLNTPSPQWLVFTVDMAIIVIATWLTLYFNGNPSYSHTGLVYSMPGKIGFVALVYAVTMLIVRPYKSIVRLSAFEDMWRVAWTVLYASLAIAAFEVAFGVFASLRYVGLWSVFVLGVIAFAALVTVRISVKYLYRVAFADTQRRRVAVLGSNINSLALATALASEIDGQFEPVLMLSLGSGKDTSSVNGIPVRHYDPETVAELFNSFDCDTLVFMNNQLDFMRNGAADIFMGNNIRLMVLNQVAEFDGEDDNQNTVTVSPHVQDIKIEDLLGRACIINDNPAIVRTLRDKVVMVTGAAGSIGSEIVRQVSKYNPRRIILVDQAETPMHELQLEMEHDYPHARIRLCVADVANERRINDLFDRYRPQIVFHAAAYKHVPMMERNPCEAVMTNIFGTKCVADCAERYGCEQFVMVSTDKAVNPTNVMGASKRIAEIYVQSLALKIKAEGGNGPRFITTRFGNVLGSNGSVIPLFRKQIENGGPVTVTHRDIIRYFMTIPEACSLVLDAGCMGAGGEIFVFDMGNPVRIYDLAKRMISLAGLQLGRDIEIVETGLRPGEKLYEELLNDHETTLPTHHSKIMIAKVRMYDLKEVLQRLKALSKALNEEDEHDIVLQMKKIVPEFKSQNSDFATIDSEIVETETMHELNPA